MYFVLSESAISARKLSTYDSIESTRDGIVAVRGLVQYCRLS